MSAYLDPLPPRDVIETPLEGLLNANGWDLGKAVRLAAGGDATVGEWLRSPFVYPREPAFCDELLALFEVSCDRGAGVPPTLDVAEALDELLRAEAVTRELGTGVVPRPLVSRVESSLAVTEDPPADRSRESRSPAADGFRALVRRWAPAPA